MKRMETIQDDIKKEISKNLKFLIDTSEHLIKIYENNIECFQLLNFKVYDFFSELYEVTEALEEIIGNVNNDVYLFLEDCYKNYENEYNFPIVQLGRTSSFFLNDSQNDILDERLQLSTKSDENDYLLLFGPPIDTNFFENLKKEIKKIKNGNLDDKFISRLFWLYNIRLDEIKPVLIEDMEEIKEFLIEKIKQYHIIKRLKKEIVTLENFFCRKILMKESLRKINCIPNNCYMLDPFFTDIIFESYNYVKVKFDDGTTKTLKKVSWEEFYKYLKGWINDKNI